MICDYTGWYFVRWGCALGFEVGGGGGVYNYEFVVVIKINDYLVWGDLGGKGFILFGFGRREIFMIWVLSF